MLQPKGNDGVALETVATGLPPEMIVEDVNVNPELEILETEMLPETIIGEFDEMVGLGTVVIELLLEPVVGVIMADATLPKELTARETQSRLLQPKSSDGVALETVATELYPEIRLRVVAEAGFEALVIKTLPVVIVGGLEDTTGVAGLGRTLLSEPVVDAIVADTALFKELTARETQSKLPHPKGRVLEEAVPVLRDCTELEDSVNMSLERVGNATLEGPKFETLDGGLDIGVKLGDVTAESLCDAAIGVVIDDATLSREVIAKET